MLRPGRWVLACTLGWLLGFVLVVGLALMLELVGASLQVIVGLGMGVGVGLAQARVLGEHVSSRACWVGSSAVGLTLPFLAWDVGALFGAGEWFSLPVCVGLGLPIVGLLQARCLRRRSLWWVLIGAIGWAVPVALIAISDMPTLPVLLRAILSFGGMLFGGVLLGALTAKPLAWLL